MKRIPVIVLLALLMIGIIANLPEQQAWAASYRKGDSIADFTFTTYDGESHRLYDILEEKDAVLINIWATWCGPCRNEFPHLQQAYEQYGDQVEIIALSCESTDTAATLDSFAQQYGLTFKIGQDPVDFLSAFGVNSIPTTFIVDRFGTICFLQSGAFPDAASVKQLLEAFIGEDYTSSTILHGIPARKPDVAAFPEADLVDALGTAGTGLVISNPTNARVWPMTISRKDGRDVLTSTNRGVDSAEAAVHAMFSAKAGDALTVTFKISSEPVFDVMEIRINGNVAKSFGGEDDWQTYACEIPADGDYQLEIAYVKNAQGAAGMDALWLDSIALHTGDEAVAALAANPVIPEAERLSIDVLNESAREILVSDPTGNIAMYYGDSRFYLITDAQAEFSFGLTGQYDPETAIVYFNYDNSMAALSDCLIDGQYVAVSGGNSINTTGYCDSSVVLHPDPETAGVILTYFKSETDINVFMSALTADSHGTPRASWRYADEVDSSAAKTPGTDLPAEVTYSLRCIDQNGQPVAGAMLQVCDEDTCQVLRSDENGLCTFTSVPYAWEVHVLKAPAGYSVDSSEVLLTPVEGGELVFTFTAN